MFQQKSISRLILLHVIAILFAITNLININIAGINKVMPLFDLMIIFYFAVFRSTFGIWFVFILGIWNDSLNGNPLGTTSLCYIILIKFFILLNNRLVIKENFNQVWKQFIGFCFSFLLLKLAILYLFNQVHYGISTIVVQFILSSLIYVLMHRFFDHLSQKLLEGF